MKSLVALYTANAREFTRDRMASLFTILIPVLFAAFFGAIFGGDSGYKLNLGIVLEDSGLVGQQILASLTSPEAGKMLSIKVGGRDEQLAALGKGDLQAVLVLPSSLSQSVDQKKQTGVDVYYDEARQSSSGIGLGVVRDLLAQTNLAVQGIQPLLVAREEAIQTHPLRPVDFFVPSVLAMSMLWLGLFGTSLPLVQQREQQVLRRLSASPVSRVTLLGGQVCWRLTVGMIQASVFLVIGVFVLGVQIEGNWPLFAAGSVLGALVFISMGYLLAGLSDTMEGAAALAQLVNFPLMFLSGIFFEPSMLPSFLRPVTNVMPLTYLADLFRQTMVGYSALHPLWLDFAVLAGCLVIFVGLGLRFFRWER